jgi:hypothetical protein
VSVSVECLSQPRNINDFAVVTDLNVRGRLTDVEICNVNVGKLRSSASVICDRKSGVGKSSDF